MENILLTSVGRRGSLLRIFKDSVKDKVKLHVTDCSNIAPALYCADERYIVPRIDSPNYIENLLKICKEHDIKAILTFIDPEIELLAKNKTTFTEVGVLPLVPDYETALLCFDKYKMFKFLSKKNIKTVKSYVALKELIQDLEKGEISFPIFIKPNTGSGSVGAQKVENLDELKLILKKQKAEYIIQEFMDGLDCGADVYVDAITGGVVSIFLKKKIENKIGGASKTVSFHDEKLVHFIKEVVAEFNFCGPIDMDFFYKDGEYYLSEINPRFGGGYLHAYGAGVDFFKLIMNNINKIPNEYMNCINLTKTTMMMYDEAVVIPNSELAE